MNRIEHRESHWKFPFVEYSCEKTDKKLPLILQLHGAGERGAGGEDLKKVEIHGFPNMVKNGEYECIFIFPQCPCDSFWAARVESILQFIDQLKEAYPVDEDRIYLTGLSMGGFGTWEMICTYPDLFAAAAPVCGGGISWRVPGDLKCPVWAFHGDKDDTVPPIYSQLMVDAVNERGGNAKYTIFHNVWHDSWVPAYEETTLIDWLATAKKQ